MALFADSGATTLYTLFSGRRASHFAATSGLLEYPRAGYVALEFSGTHYADALYSLDVCGDCVAKTNEDLWTKLDVGDLQSFAPYINADVGFNSPRPYALSVRSGRAVVIGGVLRFYLQNVRGEIVAHRSDTIFRPSRTSADELSDAFFLFETLALLRAAKASDPEAWSSFMRQLSSDSFVRMHPAPWDLYTRSFCAVYPDMPDFYNCSPWTTH